MLVSALTERRILVVEDEYMLADELSKALNDAGAIVLGPVPSLEEAFDLINNTLRIDGAILDVNLRGMMVFPAADLLQGRAVPFLFTTGYNQSVIPARFDTITRCEKPVRVDKVSRELIALLQG